METCRSHKGWKKYWIYSNSWPLFPLNRWFFSTLKTINVQNCTTVKLSLLSVTCLNYPSVEVQVQLTNTLQNGLIHISKTFSNTLDFYNLLLDTCEMHKLWKLCKMQRFHICAFHKAVDWRASDFMNSKHLNCVSLLNSRSTDAE